MLKASSFNNVVIKGIEFRGNRYSVYSPVINTKDVKAANFVIKNCKFIGMRGTVIRIENTANAKIEQNRFENCHYYGVISDNRSKGTSVIGNVFDNMGKRMQCCFCITCHGEDYYVANNILRDFGYGGIGVGVWHDDPQYAPSKGIVENNELFFTEKYRANIEDKCIMDGGAIYVWTKNDGAIIRQNYIHDFGGIKDNRGIFCDDGARNFVIENNVITNISNSYCIDSRRVKKFEKFIGPTNVNNVIKGNIVDGKIRFEGRDSLNNGCHYGKNYFLKPKETIMPRCVISNVQINDNMDSIDFTGMYKGKVGISSVSYNRIKKTPGWRNFKKIFIRRDN